MTWSPPDLNGKVALVTGASRGVGRGVALALGDAGATVWITGRSTDDGPRTEDLPGTVDTTAREVDSRGGKGVAVRCDHTIDEDVDSLFRRIEAESGSLDLLVNNAWSGYERGEESRFDSPFWEQPRWRWDAFAGSLRGQFVASQLAAPLMIRAKQGLIVNMSFTDGDTPLGQTAYDVVKHASDRMAMDMAIELRKHGVASVALHPGLVRTERVEAAWSLLGEGPAQAAHSAEYVGRAVAHLAAHDMSDVSGERLAVGDLAERFGFDDIDGRRLPAFRLEGRMTLATRMERLNRVVARAREEKA